MSKKFIDKLHPRDVIACVTLLVGLILKFRGLDGTVGVLMTLIVGYYFAKRTKDNPEF